MKTINELLQVPRLQRDAQGRFTPTHGQTNTRLYSIWVGMRKRCNNPKDRAYINYGGRGITVCDEWNGDFAAFRDWALASGYNDHLSIDRIDNDQGYSPDNCRWTTTRCQNGNKRTVRRFVIDGQEMTIKDISERYHLNLNTLNARLRRGLSIEKATGNEKQPTPPAIFVGVKEASK